MASEASLLSGNSAGIFCWYGNLMLFFFCITSCSFLLFIFEEANWLKSSGQSAENLKALLILLPLIVKDPIIALSYFDQLSFLEALLTLHDCSAPSFVTRLASEARPCPSWVPLMNSSKCPLCLAQNL